MKKIFLSACVAASMAVASSSTFAADCTPGNYSVDGHDPCTPCERGYYTDSFASLFCSPCDAGRFSSSTGATVCNNCSQGTYSNAPASTSCTNCEAGKYGAASGVTTCTNCTAGTFSTAVGATTSATCTQCNPGSFSESDGSTNCDECDAGTFSSTLGSTTCSACSFGHFASSTASTICDSCAAGTFSNTSAATICSNCGPGTFSGTLASTTCTNCLAGKYSTAVAATSSSTCQDCPAGTAGTAAGAASCQNCTPGNFSASSGVTTCSDCAVGTYSETVSSTVCQNCATGTYTPAPGATTSTACTRDGKRCWIAKDLKDPAFVRRDSVSTSDSVAASATVGFKSLGLYCANAGYAGALPANPDPHQCCYKTTGGKLDPQVLVDVTGARFGSRTLSLSKPAFACEQCDGSTSDQSLLCWRAKDKSSSKFVSQLDLATTDGISTDLIEVTKPALYCAPVSYNGTPITDSQAAQCCYKEKGAVLETPITRTPTGALGGTFKIEVEKQVMVCEPCTVAP